MSFDHYIQSGGKRLRCGYTTGTCAALAAQGAARLLLTGQAPERVSLRTPKGWVVEVPVEGHPRPFNHRRSHPPARGGDHPPGRRGGGPGHETRPGPAGGRVGHQLSAPADDL